MKKLVYLLILTLICPVIFVFTGCEKKETRDILKFYDYYLEIADSSNYLIVQNLPERFSGNENSKKIGFNYSAELQQKMIETNSKFSKLDTFYNELLDDALAPVYLYGNLFSVGDISEKEKKSIFADLDNLKDCYIKMSSRLSDIERTQGNTANPETSSVAGQNLAKLFSSYEPTISIATRLSRKISDIYFNRVLSNSNPDYSTRNPAYIDLSDIAIRAKNRFFYYQAIYADIFNEIYVKGKNIPQLILSAEIIPTYTPYEAFKRTSYSTILNENIEEYRGEIIELAKTLYTIQLSFDTEYRNYQDATGKIVYNNITSTSSLEDKAYKSIIDQFINENGIVYASYRTLKSILDYCY